MIEIIKMYFLYIFSPFHPINRIRLLIHIILLNLYNYVQKYNNKSHISNRHFCHLYFERYCCCILIYMPALYHFYDSPITNINSHVLIFLHHIRYC